MGLQFWGGAECTVSRTRNGYLDQTRISGHHSRFGDLALFKDLGLEAIRYPILWERVAPLDPEVLDCRWADERLGALRRHGIRPIAGLVHHGSGPRYTNLLDEGFAAGLGRYAGKVAERYAWIEDWTPINEPVTTARFSALYGHWFPHHRSELSFWLALLNQIDATRAAMRAIRRINPAARLIQTDDLGRTYATAPLADQAGFDNQRRWAGWDLLFGKVTPQHPLWQHLAELGLSERLHRIADDPCPPDIVGINHYLTSDRFLDHRIERYPPHTHGGNGRVAYADVEAVRVLEPAPSGLRKALQEAWDRYGAPLAVTEVHNGCTREGQLRWAAEAWDTSVALRSSGIDIRAVTAWSLLGSHSWDKLLTAPGTYESGLFDVATGTPRATALAKLWRGLPGGEPRHPVANQPGWWRSQGRLAYPPLPRVAKAVANSRKSDQSGLLICGATGTLGRSFARACAARGIPYRLIGRQTLDLEQGKGAGAVLDALRPWGVVNAAGWVRVDDAEAHEETCHRVNAIGAIELAQACSLRGVPYLGFSSDLVFDGNSARPYIETDIPAPLNAYGRSKAAMEAGCLSNPGVLIVRTAAFFSAFDPHNFAWAVAEASGRGQTFTAADDQVVSPTFVPFLVNRTLDLLIDQEQGIWHITDGAALTWAAFAKRIVESFGHDPALIRPVAGAALGLAAARPCYAALASSRSPAVDHLSANIARFVHDHRLVASQRRAELS